MSPQNAAPVPELGVQEALPKPLLEEEPADSGLAFGSFAFLSLLFWDVCSDCRCGKRARIRVRSDARNPPTSPLSLVKLGTSYVLTSSFHFLAVKQGRHDLPCEDLGRTV